MFSFARDKKTIELFPRVRRICDLTTPNLATAYESRSEDRFNRTIPTLIAPWAKRKPVVSAAKICLTSDLADRGVRLILNHPIDANEVVLGYWLANGEMPYPWFFLGAVKRLQPIGGHYWALGVEFTKYANCDHSEALEPLKGPAADLLPPQDE